MRKPGSEVRVRIGKILSVAKKAYGYEIYRIYTTVYGDVLLRTIYYNLKKGVELGDFEAANLMNVPGNFTWGFESNRVYYRNKRTLKLEENEKRLLETAVKNLKKEMKNEIKKWIVETSKEVKKDDLDTVEKMKLLSKCLKIKKFYQENFGKYPKEIDEWITTLTP
jgi:hypothetical protein